MKPIRHTEETIEQLKDRGLMHLARHLSSLGFTKIVTLESGITATQCYENKYGILQFVFGSRSLFVRYINKTA